MVLGGHALGTAALGANPLKQAEKIVTEIDLITIDAKLAIKDYLRKTYEDLWDKLTDLMNLNAPSGYEEAWEIFKEFIKSQIGL